MVTKPHNLILNTKHPLANGLVFAAEFYEGTGTSAQDLAGAVAGSIIASGATWVNDNYGWDLDFSAAASSVSYASVAAQNSLTNVSVEALVFPRSNGGNNLGRIIHKNNTNGDAYFQTNMDNVRGLVWVASTSGTHPIWKVTALSTNIWSHIIWTWDGVVADSPVYYLNGVSQTVTVDTAGSGSRATDTSNLYIGNRQDGLRNFDGKIVYCRVWNRILSATEAALLYVEKWRPYNQPNFHQFFV